MHDITLCLLHCHTKWKSNGKINNENVTQRLACSITSLQMEIKKTTLVSLISQCILLKNKVHSAVSVSLSSKSVFTLKGLNQCCAVLKDCMPVSCQCLSLLRSYGPKGVVLSTQYSKLLHCIHTHCNSTIYRAFPTNLSTHQLNLILSCTEVCTKTYQSKENLCKSTVNICKSAN